LYSAVSNSSSIVLKIRYLTYLIFLYRINREITFFMGYLGFIGFFKVTYFFANKFAEVSTYIVYKFSSSY